MTELQALITEVIVGALAAHDGFDLELDQQHDRDNNYLPAVIITGRQSRDRVLVSVAPLTPLEERHA